MATPIGIDISEETAVTIEAESGVGIGRIVTGLAVGLLIIGVLAVIVLRSELFS